MNPKHIVITGGSSGIGFELAKLLVARGDQVTIIAENVGKLANATKQLEAIVTNPSQIFSAACNVTDYAKLNTVVSEAHKRFGKIDVLVNNAGLGRYQTFEDSSIEDDIMINNVNFLGVVKTTKAVLPYFIEAQAGHIINISSLAGKFTITPSSIYCGAKHAVVGFTNALRYELRRYKIKVSLVCPGKVSTDFFLHESFQKRRIRPEMQLTTPIHKVGQELLKVIDSPKDEVYIPSFWKIIYWFKNFTPWALNPIFAYVHQQRIKEYYEPRKPL